MRRSRPRSDARTGRDDRVERPGAQARDAFSRRRPFPAVGREQRAVSRYFAKTPAASDDPPGSGSRRWQRAEKPLQVDAAVFSCWPSRRAVRPRGNAGHRTSGGLSTGGPPGAPGLEAGVLLVVLMIAAIGVAIIAALLWVAFSADDEQEQRERRTQRDFDLKRGN